MKEQNQTGKAPDFSADGIAVWQNTTKDGKPYLSVKIVGHNTINAFKNEPKEKGTAPTKEQVLKQLLDSGMPLDRALEQLN